MEMDAGDEGCGSEGSGSRRWQVEVEAEMMETRSTKKKNGLFISTDLVVDDVDGEEDQSYGDDDGKTGLSPQGDTHPGTLTTLY